jgi:streptomycin 6-kinase
VGPVIEIPAEFVRWTVAREGERGRAWIAALPGLVAHCLDRWQLRPDGPVRHGFTAVVLTVRRDDGAGAVLKVSWVDEDSRWEPHALAAWAGRGAVALLDRDDAAGALLLERLDPARTVRELDGVAAAAVAGRLARRLAVPPPAGLPRLAERAARWAEELPGQWRRLGRPLDRAALDAAVATCRELGPDQPELLLHGDLVFDNVLRGEREPWLVIDPYGLVGEPAFDAAKLLGNRWSELTARGDLRGAVDDRLAAYADGAGVDVERARRWAQARLLRDALWCREHQPDAVPYVDALVDVLG